MFSLCGVSYVTVYFLSSYEKAMEWKERFYQKADNIESNDERKTRKRKPRDSFSRKSYCPEICRGTKRRLGYCPKWAGAPMTGSVGGGGDFEIEKSV